LQIDCTAEADLCRTNFITAFPSIRVFRRAHDDIYVNVSGLNLGVRTALASKCFAAIPAAW
jgi:hypothetical protein